MRVPIWSRLCCPSTSQTHGGSTCCHGQSAQFLKLALLLARPALSLRACRDAQSVERGEPSGETLNHTDGRMLRKYLTARPCLFEPLLRGGPRHFSAVERRSTGGVPRMVESNGHEPRRPVRSGAVTVSHPDLEWREAVKGSKPGDRFIRVATHKGFRHVGRGHLVPRKGTGAPTTPSVARSSASAACSSAARWPPPKSHTSDSTSSPGWPSSPPTTSRPRPTRPKRSCACWCWPGPGC